jgi:hypothetical protein
MNRIDLMMVVIGQETEKLPVNGDNDQDKDEAGPGLFRVMLRYPSGETILAYTREPAGSRQMPGPVIFPLNEANSNDPDSLYYAGLRYELLHDPRVDPADFYKGPMNWIPVMFRLSPVRECYC